MSDDDWGGFVRLDEKGEPASDAGKVIGQFVIQFSETADDIIVAFGKLAGEMDEGDFMSAMEMWISDSATVICPNCGHHMELGKEEGSDE